MIADNLESMPIVPLPVNIRQVPEENEEQMHPKREEGAA